MDAVENAIEKLHEARTETMTTVLQKLITDPLKEDPYLQLEDVEDLGNKYLATFGSMRKTLAWRTYETQLQKTKNPHIQPAFQTFFRSVLEGTHIHDRYRRGRCINS